MNAYQTALASMYRAGLAGVLDRRMRKLEALGYIRALGYHDTPPGAMPVFRRQVEFLAKNHVAVDEKGLGDFLAGNWKHDRPGLILSFDDGLVDNYRCAAAALEEQGLVGWFFVSSGLPGLAPERQLRFCLDGRILKAAPPAPPGEDRASPERLGMDWSEIRELLGRGHVIGCHTATHRRFLVGSDPGGMEAELRESRETFREELGGYPASFAWVGGEGPGAYAPEGFAAVRKLGFRYAFTTKSFPIFPGADPLALHRTMIDADTDFGAFRMKIAGISDLAHARDRRKIERAFAGANAGKSAEPSPESPRGGRDGQETANVLP
jgi:peptidoglycan/xylan/chitin deacetylase (PgdA/CDA1 family)